MSPEVLAALQALALQMLSIQATLNQIQQALTDLRQIASDTQATAINAQQRL